MWSVSFPAPQWGEPINEAFRQTTYLATVQIGNPPTAFTLLVDTGSSNTWVGAGTPYKQTATSLNTGQPVAVDYGFGEFVGVEFLDQVSLGPGLVISQQSIGVASSSSGFEGVDGVLGLGPIDLTEGTLTKNVTATIPTVSNNLFAQGSISTNEIGFFFEPTNSINPTPNGILAFGGIQPANIVGAIGWTPLTTLQPAGSFVGVANWAASIGSTNLNLGVAGIVDPGSTLILIPTPAFKAYQAATGAHLDPITGLLTISAANFSTLQPLNYHCTLCSGPQVYALPPNGQLWPRALNTAIGGSASSLYLVINDSGTTGESGLDFIFGQAFMERFFTVVDYSTQQLGWAQTTFTNATTN